MLDNILTVDIYRAHVAPFEQMRETIANLLKTIDYYTDVVEKKYGGTCPPPSYTTTITRLTRWRACRTGLLHPTSDRPCRGQRRFQYPRNVSQIAD